MAMQPQASSGASGTGSRLKRKETQSLLRLPSEIRVAIYRYLFDRVVLNLWLASHWDPLTKRHECVVQPEDSDETSIDDGITLTCSLLRNESLSVLRHNLELFCTLDRFAGSASPVHFPVKPDYLKSIRKAHFVFIELDYCDLPFHELPALEDVLFECDGSSDPLAVRIDQDCCRRWASEADHEDIVKNVKGCIIIEATGSCLHNMLSDKARRFSVRWKDVIVLEVDGDRVGDVVDITFDWDTSKLIEGADYVQGYCEDLLDELTMSAEDDIQDEEAAAQT